MAVLYSNPNQAKSIINRNTSLLQSNKERDRLRDVDALIELAEMQGGSLAEVARELKDPNRSILSTIGNKFKQSFKTFVDIISVPSQVVAGTISSEYTIKEAIQKNISPSDVLFGETDPDATAMKKVGSFFARASVDILTDPLTYVTFGAGQGIFGIRAATKITAGEKLAKFSGKQMGDFVALNERGKKLYENAVKAQVSGLEATAKKTAKIRNMTDKEADLLVKATLESKLDRDFVKTSISNMLEKNPGLMEDFIDKGGFKFFGKSILSGQRISDSIKLIPGMKWADTLTEPLRNRMSALFSNQHTLGGRIPDEEFQIMQKWKDLAESQNVKTFNHLADVYRKLGITAQQDEFIRTAVELGKPPADPILAQAYYQIKKVNKDNLKQMWEAGIRVSEVPNYIPHLLVKQEVSPLAFKLPPSQTVKAAKQAKIKRFEDIGMVKGERLADPIIDFIDSKKLERLGEAKDVFGKETREKFGLKETDELFSDADGITRKAVRATIEDAKTLGVEFDPSAISATLKSTMDNIKGTTAKHMIRELSEKAGVPASRAPEGFRAVNIKNMGSIEDFSTFGAPKTKQFDSKSHQFFMTPKGEELYFHPLLAKRIEEFAGKMINDEATNELLRAFDKIQGVWKASVTSIFPAFHGRNAISNVFQHYLDIGLHSLNPTNHYLAADIINKERKISKIATQMATGKASQAVKDEYFNLMNTVMLKDSTGYEWTMGELRRVISQRNVAFNPNLIGSLDVQKTGSEFISELFPSKGKKIVRATVPYSQEFAPFKLGRKIGNFVEEEARLMDFIVNLRKTGDVEMAAQRTKMFLFDYQNLTPFEREFMRRIIPFYTFTRKNLELQTKTLLTAPGRISQELTIVNTIGDVISGGSLTKEEEDLLPDWIKDGVSILRKKRGSTVEIFGGLGTPLEQPFQAFQPNVLLGSISPLIRLPVEQMSGYSFFQGKPLSDVTNASAFKSAPKFLQDFIGFTSVQGKRSDGTPFEWYVSLRPERMNLLLNLPPTSRVFSALKQMQAVEVSDQSKILQQLIGVRPFSFDLEQEATKKETALRRELEDILTKAGVTAKFQRVYIPKE